MDILRGLEVFFSMEARSPSRPSRLMSRKGESGQKRDTGNDAPVSVTFVEDALRASLTSFAEKVNERDPLRLLRALLLKLCTLRHDSMCCKTMRCMCCSNVLAVYQDR